MLPSLACESKQNCRNLLNFAIGSGFEIYLSHRKGLRLETPGVLRRYFEEGQQVVNAWCLEENLATRQAYRRQQEICALPASRASNFCLQRPGHCSSATPKARLSFVGTFQESQVQ